MIRFVTAAAISLVASLPFLGGDARAAEIDWSIERSGTRPESGEVQLRVESRWDGNKSSWSRGYQLSELRGLGAAQLVARPAPVRFALAREAGRLDCSGIAGNSSGRGSCSFAADPAFAAYLAQRGIARPDTRRAFSLAMSGVSRRLVDALTGHGYPKPTLDQLVAMGIHGVTGEYVRDLALSGYRLQSADKLVAFKIHGVSADYARAIAAAGPQLRNLPADDLVAFKIHGVTPELVRAYTALGRSADKDEVIAMRIHGVTPQYINQMAALGYRRLTADELVQMRIHGVTPEYVHALQRQGIRTPSADQLVRLRISGFRANRR
jgi:hypothetical protein